MTETNLMKITVEKWSYEWALHHIKQGHTASRVGWHGNNQWVEMIHPAEGSRVAAPFIVIHTDKAELIPWQPSQTDQLTNDWTVVPRLPPILAKIKEQDGKESDDE